MDNYYINEFFEGLNLKLFGSLDKMINCKNLLDNLNVNMDAKNQEQFRGINLMLFVKVIAFDNFKQKIIIITNMKADYLENNYQKESNKPLTRSLISWLSFCSESH